MRRVTVVSALFGLVLSAAMAHASDPTLRIDKAAIEGGRLMIEGKSNRPGMQVSVAGTLFKTRTDRTGKFSFRLLWRPDTCRLRLTFADRSRSALVSGCGPKGSAGILGNGAISAGVSEVAGSNDWTFVGTAAETVPAVAGEAFLIAISFNADALTSSVDYPNTPPPANAAFELAGCLRGSDGKLLLADQISTAVARPALPNAVFATSRRVQVTEAGHYSPGLCVRTGAPDGLVIDDLGGFWIKAR